MEEVCQLTVLFLRKKILYSPGLCELEVRGPAGNSELSTWKLRMTGLEKDLGGVRPRDSPRRSLGLACFL